MVMTDFAAINACAKRPTDIWTNYLYYPFSLRLVYLIRHTRISPNMLTISSLILVLAGCVGYAMGSHSALLWGLLVIQISYVFDCADGQLARYKKQYSPIGGWLDQTADRIKEFTVYFSLAYGYTRFHPGDTSVWMWAMVALFALFLLEYFGQIEMFRTNGRKSSVQVNENGVPVEVQADAQAPSDAFRKLQRWRSFLPFRGFIIGEQYFAMLVFIGFGAVYPFFVCVSVLGLLMALYRPVIDAVKYRRSRA